MIIVRNLLHKIPSFSGVGWMKRKVASAIKPSMNIRQDASHYHIEVSAKITTKVWDFNVGDSFEEQGELNKITCMVNQDLFINSLY